MSTETKESRICHFRIDSAFVVDKARDCILEGNPHGIRILMDGLEGMDYQTCYEILRGEKTLTGIAPEEEIRVIKDCRKKYKRALANRYAGVLRIGNKFYQPSAYIFAFGREDADYALENGEIIGLGNGRPSAGFTPARVRYYSQVGEKHFALKMTLHGFTEERPVFFAPLEWFPEFLPYFNAPDGVQAALDAFKAADRRVEARGPDLSRTDDDRVNPFTGKPAKKRKPRAHRNPGSPIEPTTKLHKYVKLDYDPDDSYVSWFEEVAGMLCDLNGTPLDKPVSDFKVLETVEAENCDTLDWRGTYLHRGEDDAVAGWVTPEGIFYGCDYGQHRMLTEMMFHAKYEKMMEDDGFVKIWYGPKEKLGPYQEHWICFKALTDAQRATLTRMGHDVSKNDNIYRSDA